VVSHLLSADAQALLAAEAFVRDVTVPATGYRHLRIDDQPLIVVPLVMAGEDSAPLAFGVGRSEDELEIIAIAEPRNRDEAWAGLERFAERLLDWIDPLVAELREAARSRTLEGRPPQLIVPAPSALVLLRKLAGMMTWSKGELSPSLRRAGGWLHFFCERPEVAPDDASFLVLTEAIRTHWTLPLSGAESAHTLAMVEALEAEEGSAIAAAREAEGRPGGALTSPVFDDQELQPAIEAYNAAAGAEKEAAAETVRGLLAQVVAPQFHACLRAVERLRDLPPVPPVLGRRAEEECRAVLYHADYLGKGGHFARADSMRRSLVIVGDGESRLKQQRFESRYFDPVVRAPAVLTGEALEGTVAVGGAVKVPRGRDLRLDLVVRTVRGWRPAPRSTYRLCCGWDKAPLFTVLEVLPEEEGTRVRLRTEKYHREATGAWGAELTLGCHVALVKEESDFHIYGLREGVPWMFSGGGSDAE
jgi:hypothetical protein